MADVNADQRAYWNSASGAKWVRYDQQLEVMQREVTETLMARSGISAGSRVLDLGCGTGATTREAARMAGAGGRVTGVDISEPLLAHARSVQAGGEAAPISYLCADAQVDDLGSACFDRVISRLGSMFFEDPVAACANIRAAVAPGGTMALICWRRGEDNPWFSLPRQVAVSHLGDEPTNPDAPGALAFGDEVRVCDMLTRAGWEVRCDPVALHLTPEGSPEDVARLATRLGPAVRLISVYQADAAQIAAIEADIADVFRGYETGGEVRIPAVMNLFSATGPA
ncbi:MAG: class I SAM-dependent methyltransferase [Rhodobacteraceae bacterium]|nr:class I SAM-dependent methyltransferase [Paracoccaceae bacterium]